MKRFGILAFLVFGISSLTSLTPNASAAPFLRIYPLNSELTFGGATFEHFGSDVHDMAINGNSVDDATSTNFTANGGSLVATTPGLNGTWYEYAGGAIDFELLFTFNGTHYTGSFSAPILSLKVFAAEPLEPGDSNVDVYYELGGGQFDAALSNAFGMPRHTLPASAFGNFILFEGDSSSPQLVANDGAIDFGFAAAPVPEPSLSVLAAAGVLAALGQRIRRRT